MKARHIPGPWTEHAPEIEGVIDQNYRYIQGGDLDSQTGDRTTWGVGYFSLAGFVSPATARLIAAAPDLLALAKQYASECGECDGTGVRHLGEDYIGDEIHPITESCPDCADIRAVIAKAEGNL